MKEDINKYGEVVGPGPVKESLRRLGESRYYEDKYFFAEMLGWETPMHNLIASNLLSDFEEFNDAYSKIEKDRMNSLPFSFILYKIVEQQSDLPQEQKESILEVLFEDLSQLYKEWINPSLLVNYDEFNLILRKFQIEKLQDILDKTMEQMNNDTQDNNPRLY